MAYSRSINFGRFPKICNHSFIPPFSPLRTIMLLSFAFLSALTFSSALPHSFRDVQCNNVTSGNYTIHNLRANESDTVIDDAKNASGTFGERFLSVLPSCSDHCCVVIGYTKNNGTNQKVKNLLDDVTLQHLDISADLLPLTVECNYPD